jgi:hypothetical protein
MTATRAGRDHAPRAGFAVRHPAAAAMGTTGCPVAALPDRTRYPADAAAGMSFVVERIGQHLDEVACGTAGAIGDLMAAARADRHHLGVAG